MISSEAAMAEQDAAVELRHVVALPFPMQGHINPMLALCRRLAARSIHVTFVNTPRNHKRLLLGSSPSPSSASSSSQDGLIEFVALPDGLPEAAFTGEVDEAVNSALMASANLEKPFQAFLQRLASERGEQRPLSCIISDGYLGWTQDVANRFSLQRVALWTSNAAYHLVLHHLPTLIEHGYAARQEPGSFDKTHLVTCVPGLKPLHPSDLPTVIQMHSDADPGFRKRMSLLRKMKEASWVLVNSCYELEEEAVSAMREALGHPRYVTVGPLLLNEDESGLRIGDNRCLPWLDEQRPRSVLYISFGSMAAMSKEQFRLFQAGIEGSGSAFLWALRVVPKGCEEDHDAFVQRTKARGLVVQWASQIRVLQHDAVGGHLSHCGWNSMMESIYAGIPVLAWPCIAEQTMNGKRAAADWGFALSFERGADGLVSAAEVQRRVSQLFEQRSALTEAMPKVSALLSTSVRRGGSSYHNLENFVSWIQQV